MDRLVLDREREGLLDRASHYLSRGVLGMAETNSGNITPANFVMTNLEFCISQQSSTPFGLLDCVKHTLPSLDAEY